MAPTLLTLPGELRNAIYEYAASASQADEQTGPKTVTNPPATSTAPLKHRVQEVPRHDLEISGFMCHDGILLPKLSARRARATKSRIHPLAHLIQQTRSEFLGYVCKTRVQQASLSFTVTNSDFTELFKVLQQYPSKEVRQLSITLEHTEGEPGQLENLSQLCAAYEKTGMDDEMWASPYELLGGSYFSVKFKEYRSTEMRDNHYRSLHDHLRVTRQAVWDQDRRPDMLSLHLLFHYERLAKEAENLAWSWQAEMAARRVGSKDAERATGPVWKRVQKRHMCVVDDGFATQERQRKRRKMGKRPGRWAVDEGYDKRGSRDEGYWGMMSGLAALRL
ncbi:hypothetical protein LTR36_008965 [Oleoguttula mirabilis]|uniref:Uncharacterized protein n=1 Tax=Oleoguttula mirabilis TaxID=1507867 RepID=A0AAV9J787_9PEZI|nr:hypothetical protein LTR36_008965 [Oleoguttula mirabilis]